LTQATNNKLPLGVRASFGTLPPLAGKFSGPAIVLGRADGWVDELDAAFALTSYEAPVFAVNGHVEEHYPGCIFEHEISIHCQSFPGRDKRREDVTYHAEKPLCNCPNADVFWPIPGMGAGSSALLAVFIAINMGYSPVYVAGVKLSLHTVVDIGNGQKMMHDYRFYQDGWRAVEHELKGRVFSMGKPGDFLFDLLGGA